jgi:curli biogenesis system outer membrane secretion channel CsgG
MTPHFTACATSSGAQGSAAEQGQLGSEFHTYKPSGPKKRIGVLDFGEGNGGHSRYGEVDQVAREAVTEALVKSGAFVVVEREQLANVLKEQGLGQTGAISAQSAAKVAKLLGLQALVTGKVTDYTEDQQAGGFVFVATATRTAVARVSLRVIDAATGEIWLAESGQGQVDSSSVNVLGVGAQKNENSLGKRALYKAIGSLMDKIVAKADLKPWAGSVVRVTDDKVYISAGSDTNLEEGTMLKVRKLRSEIVDPLSGAVIGREIGAVAGSVQIAQHLNEKLSVCIVAKGSGFTVGDEVTVDKATATAQ